MSSQAIEDARTLTRAVVSALEKHVIPAADLINAGRQQAEQKTLSLQGALDIESLQGLFEVYAGASEVLDREVGEDRDARGQRDEAALALRQTLSNLSRVVELIYGAEAAQTLNLQGKTPIGIRQLITKARGFVTRTETMPSLPDPSDPWIQPNLEEARAKIGELVSIVEEARSNTVGELRETQSARLVRNRAGDKWYKELRFHISMARAILAYADQEELAAKILPTERQIRRVEPVPGGEPEPSEPTDEA